MAKGIKLGLCLFFTGIIIFQYGRSWAVVPYPVPQPSAAPEISFKEPVKQLKEGLKKHEEENTRSFHEIKDELRRIKEQNLLIAKEEKSWKLVTTGLFIFNFILCIFLGVSLRFRRE